MPIAAVLGWPLTRTLSPPLHNAAYAAAGLTGWSYEARPTPPEGLAVALAEVRAGRLAGVNLTVPHKQAAVPLLDDLLPPAAEAGAVNTVVPRDGGLTGANTDVPGGLWALQAQLGLGGPDWDGSGTAVLLGTGGVALAMALAWRRLGAARAAAGLPTAPLTVAGRDPDRAATVAALAGPGATTIGFQAAADQVAGAGVVIQATTLTAIGRPVPGQDRLAAGARVLDCNYGDTAQGLVEAARAAGAAAAVDGVGMLLAQAAEAIVLMAGFEPDRAAMAAAVGLPWPG
jgi:shikimate 5-dehydrogenase